jgi:hypothetical protein
MKDTPANVEARYREMLLSLSPIERLVMACRMFSTAKALVQAGILNENPELDEKALRGKIFQRFYGGDFSASESERILRHLGNT